MGVTEAAVSTPFAPAPEGPTSYTVVSLAGDGIGPEVMREAIRALQALRRRIEIEERPVRRNGIRESGDPLPARRWTRAWLPTRVLLAAVGSPEYERAAVRPEQGLLRLRKRARRVREPAPGAGRRCRRDDRPRALGRPLLRPEGPD